MHNIEREEQTDVDLSDDATVRAGEFYLPYSVVASHFMVPLCTIGREEQTHINLSDGIMVTAGEFYLPHSKINVMSYYFIMCEGEELGGVTNTPSSSWLEF